MRIPSITTHRHVSAAVIIDTAGRFLFQQRDDIPSILYPGQVGLFGGHREGSETFRECIVREIYEELSYLVAPERFEYLATYRVDDPAAEGGMVYGKFFVVRDLPVNEVVVMEGSLLIAELSELSKLKNVTEGTQFAIEALFSRPIW